MVDPVDQIWQKILLILEPFFPYLENDSAIQEETKLKIEEAEENLGVLFPLCVKSYYQALNQILSSTDVGLFYGFTTFPVETSIKAWREFLEDPLHEQSMETGIMRSESVVPDGKAKLDYFNKKWLPIAHDYGGTYLALDFSPTPSGSFGQIINFGASERTRFVLFKDIAAFGHSLLRNLENSRCDIIKSDDEIIVQLKYYETDHLIDLVAEHGLTALEVCD